MDNGVYTALSRQSGLLREMQIVANNVANVSTTGFRREGLHFSEFIHAMPGDAPSLSMTSGDVRRTDWTEGNLSQTGGTFDLAIEGDGFFTVETPEGVQLTRAGTFTPNEAGELVTPDGYRLLDTGGAAIFVPASATSVAVAADGTLSIDGLPQNQIGVAMPVDPNGMTRTSATLFTAQGGFVPADGGRVLQGFLEGSNVNPVAEIARMIEVQRAYELGQKLLDDEHDRIRSVTQTLSR